MRNRLIISSHHPQAPNARRCRTRADAERAQARASRETSAGNIPSPPAQRGCDADHETNNVSAPRLVLVGGGARRGSSRVERRRRRPGGPAGAAGMHLRRSNDPLCAASSTQGCGVHGLGLAR